MKKNIGRKIAILLLAILFVVAAVLKLKIEPASYKKTLKNEIKKAEDLLVDANIGNDKNQYSNYVILDLKNQIKVAKEIQDNKDSYYDIEKSAYEELKNAVKQFKKDKNNNCISKDNIKKLKENSKKIVKTAVLNKKYKVTWTINGKNINKSEAINLEAKTKSPYTNRVNEYIEKLNLNCKKISFYHNGKLPVEAKIYVNYKYNSKKDKIYVYKFNTKDNILEYKDQAIVNDSNVEFNISEGGDYILLKNKLEDYASKEEIKNISKEIKQNENKLDLKNKEEKIEEKDTTSKKNENKKDKESNDSNKKDIAQNKDKSSQTEGNSSNKTSGNNANSNTLNNNTTNNKENNQNNNQGNNNNTQPSGNTEEVNKKVTCTIEIRCDTLVVPGKLQNPSKENYIPSDGTILPKVTVTVDEGQTVYDVLLSVCRNYNIQIDAEYSQTYSSYYVKGIRYLYEFDGGDLSGWMYSVNGDFPNYGCSSYKVKNGDSIKWLYTCDMGTDIGEDHSDWK